MVAHVLHTPMTALEDVLVEDLLAWADDARALIRQVYGPRRKSGR